ncbi:CobQ/CobB/MinD/ParA nucleotide binding domain protein [Gemmata obscuriglobus]|uniref:Response regulatory domain-containing protein n=1 Tax=Gemmata obscuriglobus TaxID=114 RepID=A0A2Z3GZ93_9BACT|nr:pilus assembly protein CpaE [Gemmata obscuriglobus]AWM39083.1 hypothetical protein C1280_20240 [Gemmata obscuriglobus]QEG27881.1 CobQ/CobB/MinD/ParA nucleotide binding domain protein [Gemmata obscuriglobus]VTS05288.1 Uncharacterized protein OS=Planctomyces brasiliensis (strain ATCC 49424 / DSM 5305 / JCM 21570 / NBRC 103401 / IFAM 1448) GN=Plabr_3265 PE=4 SV=1: AAA_31 [Gemmata obscuriglobus UQM 2246]
MRTLLVGPSWQHTVLDRLAGLLRSHHGFNYIDRTPFEQAAPFFQESPVELVFLVLPADRAADALRAVGALAAAGARVLVVGPATDPKLILSVLQEGAERFLDQQELEPDLASVLARLTPQLKAEPRHLIAVLSASGGCGASTVAVNAAVLLAQRHGRCNLVDLNPVKADLAPLLDLKPQYTLADLCVNETRLDRTLYEKLLTPHASGVALLAGPRTPEEARQLTTAGVAEAVTRAGEAFAHVVVDLEDYFHDEQTDVLDRATRVLVVCRLDFTAVRNARRIIDALVARGVPRSRVEVVVNHAGLPNELPLGDAEAALGGPAAHVLPSDPHTMNMAANTGVPAAVQAPDAEVVRRVARLAGLTVADQRVGAVGRFTALCRGFAQRVLRHPQAAAETPAPILPYPQSQTDTRADQGPLAGPVRVPRAQAGAG